MEELNGRYEEILRHLSDGFKFKAAVEFYEQSQKKAWLEVEQIERKLIEKIVEVEILKEVLEDSPVTIENCRKKCDYVSIGHFENRKPPKKPLFFSGRTWRTNKNKNTTSPAKRSATSQNPSGSSRKPSAT